MVPVSKNQMGAISAAPIMGRKEVGFGGTRLPYGWRACRVPVTARPGVVSIWATDNSAGTPFFVPPGLSGPNPNGGNTMAISDHPVDIVNESTSKLALISDLLSHTAPTCKVDLSPHALAGLHVILMEIETDLRRASSALSAKPKEVQ